MMKYKIIVLIAVFMIATVGTAMAGSLNGADYKDSNLWWDSDRQINDNDVSIDADTLSGKTVEEIEQVSIKKGMSKNTLIDYLEDVFLPQLRKIFAPKEYCESVSDRLDYFEAKELGMTKTDYQEMKARQLGSYAGITCYWVNGVQYC